MNTEIVIKELEILNAIIARQEEISLKVRNWYITLITALTIAFISKEVSIEKLDFLIIALFLSGMFVWLELIHRVAENRAMKRARTVESALRNEIEYSGPLIGKSLVIKNSLKEQLSTLRNVRIYATYLICIFLVILIYLIK